MKNPFKAYPSVFYQIIILSTLAQAIFFIYTISNTAFSYLYTEDSGFSYEYYHLLPFVTGVSFILGGVIADRIETVRVGFIVGAISFAIGITLNYLGIFGRFTTNFFMDSGLAITTILSIKHIGILFPIANDWKDNAFLILFLSPIIGAVIIGFFLFILLDAFNFNPSDETPLLIFIINLGIVILLVLLIGRFKDIGYDIEEEDEDEEDYEENQFIKSIMILMVFLSAAFAFKIENLPFLYNPDLHGGNLSDISLGFNYLENLLFAIVTIIFVIVLLFRPSYQSNQFRKMNILIMTLLGMAILELVARGIQSVDLDNIMVSGYNYLYSFFIMPIFLSIMTHVNLNKNLGFWIGLVYGIASIFPTFISLPINQNINQYSPYFALGMLVLFIFAFRENRAFLEEKLALNKSNQGEDKEDKDGMDIIEHFVEK